MKRMCEIWWFNLCVIGVKAYIGDGRGGGLGLVVVGSVLCESFPTQRVTRFGPYLMLGFFFPLLRACSVCRIPMRRPYYGKLFGIGICLFVLWFWCLLAVSFDDWITYTQQGRWSFNVGLYEACVQGTHACRMYISAGILYSFSLGFLLLSCLLLLVSDKIIKAESPNTPLFHFDNPNDDMNK